MRLGASQMPVCWGCGGPSLGTSKLIRQPYSGVEMCSRVAHWPCVVRAIWTPFTPAAQ